VGLLDALGRQNRFVNTQGHLALEYRRPLSLGDVRARASYAESRVSEIFDPYPPGFTLLRGSARLVFPGGVVFQEDLNSRRLGAEAALERALGRGHTLTAGAAVERESTFGLRAATNFDFERQEPRPGFLPAPALVPDAARTVSSVYAQDAWNPTARLGLTGGLRLDHYDDLGAELQPRLSAAYRFPRGVALKLGYGRGARPPSFLELFYGSPAFRANAALDPVRSDSLDATALFRGKDLRLSVTAYRTWLRDVIVAGLDGIVPPGTPPPVFLNREGIDARGIDVEASRSFAGNQSLALVYSVQRAEDRESGRRLGVPTHLGRLAANFGAGKSVILSPSLTFRGARPRAAGDPRPELGAYSLVDVVARVHNFHPALELSAVAHDLLGREYFDPSPRGGLPGDYPRPGRSFFVKAKYRF
jgi:outer membrane receptor for ferrienterochelin and colicins